MLHFLGQQGCHTNSGGGILLQRGLWGGSTLLQYLIGNGRNTVSRVLFRKRELTEFGSRLSEFWKKNSVTSLGHTSYRLRGTHWALSPELDEDQKLKVFFLQHKNRIAKSQWPRWPQAGSQPFRCRNRKIFRFALPQLIASRSRFLGLASESQENCTDHSRKSLQSRDFTAAATTGH